MILRKNNQHLVYYLRQSDYTTSISALAISLKAFALRVESLALDFGLNYIAAYMTITWA